MRDQRTDATALETQRRSCTERDEPPDRGATLVELIVVVFVLGLLAASTSLAVSGMSTQASETGCAADRRQLLLATEAYFADTGASLLPALGAPDHDRFERALVAAGVLRSVSAEHDLDADGAVTPEEGSSC